MAGFHTIMMGEPLGFAKDKKYMIAGSGSFTADAKAGGGTTWYRGFGTFIEGDSMDVYTNYRMYADSTNISSLSIDSQVSSSGGTSAGPWVLLTWQINGTSAMPNSGWSKMRIRNLDGTALDVTKNRVDASYNSSFSSPNHYSTWTWTTGIPTFVSGTKYIIEWS
jgi:hypothetical protein